MKRKKLSIIFCEKQKNLILLGNSLLLLFFMIVSQDIFVIIFSLSIMLYFFIKKIINIIKFNKIYNDITLEEINHIEQELKNPIQLWKYNYVSTNNYIIMQSFDIGIIKYKDIKLIYKTTGFGARSFIRKLVIVTNDKKKYMFNIGSIGGTYPTAFDYNNNFIKTIKKQNPKVKIKF